ncbi:DUF1043 family protein [Catenovulum sp. SM1970]|uniref:ZapG family protein n=1 Tax=Marinifaba aquimaris TaxID=2741323 RepID=UPI0015728B7B|nr:DUF1043 family protein [Marinifaba aquimaris]NTS75906.1 DUF1043 family protein [Marinifaba aquimaris]
MSWIIGFALFVVGIVVGIIASRFIPALGGDKAELSAELEQSQQAQESLKQELTDYIGSVQKTFEQVAQQAEKAALAAQTYNDKIQSSDKIDEELFPFFGVETSQEIRQAVRKKSLSDSLEKTDKENAPKDYSEGSSGLLEAESAK